MYGVIRRVSTPVGTLFLLLTDFLTPSNSDSVDLSFALLYSSLCKLSASLLVSDVFIFYSRFFFDYIRANEAV